MNIIEISEKFPTELDAVTYFEQIRWGETPKCAYCGSERLSKRNKDMRFKCYTCKKTSSITINTALQGTNMALKTWLFAFSIVTDAKKGLSALQLHRNLDISYPTCLKMYHKIRDLMTMENKEVTLDGVVEMNETFVGGKPRKWNDGSTTPPKQMPKMPKLDERIEELKKAGVDFKRKRGNPAYSAINPKRGRGGHEKWSKYGLKRPITIQNHIDPIPEFIVKQCLRHLNMTKDDFFLILQKIK
ncbi:MAG: IS1595 family transposase [Bacteroidota bacterium]